MTDLELELIRAKAKKYAELLGDKSPEANYVNRYNGYFQGYVEAFGKQNAVSYAKAEAIPVTDSGLTLGGKPVLVAEADIEGATIIDVGRFI